MDRTGIRYEQQEDTGLPEYEKHIKKKKGFATMFMTPGELIELTDARLRATQKQWLDMNGWVYTVSRLGNIKVLKAYAEQRMGLGNTALSEETEPDFSHWK